MSSYSIPILNWTVLPDQDTSSTDVYFEPTRTAFATAAIPGHMVIAFANSSARQGIGGCFEVPMNYTTAPQIETKSAVTGTATAGSSAYQWDFEYRARGATEAMGSSAWDSTTPTVTVPLAGTVARDLQTAAMALTAGDLAAGNLVQFRLLRDAANASDTYNVGPVWLFGARFKYADT